MVCYCIFYLLLLGINEFEASFHSLKSQIISGQNREIRKWDQRKKREVYLRGRR